MNRLKSFEKFGFTSIEKENPQLKQNLGELRGDEPNGTINVSELWGDTQRKSSLKFGNLESDKRSFYKYLYLMQNPNKKKTKQENNDKLKNFTSVRSIDISITNPKGKSVYEKNNTVSNEKNSEFLDRIKKLKGNRKKSIMSKKVYETIESKFGIDHEVFRSLNKIIGRTKNKNLSIDSQRKVEIIPPMINY